MLVVNVVQLIVFGLNFIFLCFHTQPYLSIYAMEIKTYMNIRLEPQHMHATLDVIFFFFVFLERLSFPVSLRGPISWRLTRPIF